MGPHKESGGRGKRRHHSHLQQFEGEPDEDYRKRRDKNNEAVRRSRDKSKKKAEETQQRVEALKMENCKLEERIRMHRETLAKLKEAFLNHAANGRLNPEIDIDALLRETDNDVEASEMTS